MLAVLAFLLNQSAAERDAQREADRQKQQNRIALEGRREDAMETYLNRMAGLMLHEGLLKGAPGARASKDVATVGRTLTLTVLPRLDGKRKAQVVGFLAEAGLIHAAAQRFSYTEPRLSLWGADLRHADFRATALFEVDLSHTDLSGANFDGKYLASTSLTGAHLREASFKDAQIESVDFSYTDLTRARFDRTRIGTRWRCEPRGGGECEGQNKGWIDPPNFQGACVTGASFVDVFWDDIPPMPAQVGAFDEAEGVGVDLRQSPAKRFAVTLKERRRRVSRAIGDAPPLVDVKLDPSVQRPDPAKLTRWTWDRTGARLTPDERRDLCDISAL
jgi:hypothetical protein